MALPDPIELQRLRFEQGQKLRSQDFRDQVAIEAQLRWWHNRSLHNAYGISEGFEVEEKDAGVTVQPGLAYDYRGRELILQKPHAISLPASLPEGAEKMILLARYKETSSYSRRAALSGVCGASCSLFIESPDFLWKPAEQVALSDGVPIAQAIELNGKLIVDEEFVVARSRAMAMPRVVTGSTIPGGTVWSVWSGEAGRTQSPLGVQASIDTTAAGFTQTPCYFAWLQGALWNPNDKRLILAPFAHVAEPSIHGFTFRLWLPSGRVAPSDEANKRFHPWRFLYTAQKQNLYVCWLGILSKPEPVPATNYKGATL